MTLLVQENCVVAFTMHTCESEEQFTDRLTLGMVVIVEQCKIHHRQLFSYFYQPRIHICAHFLGPILPLS